MRRAVSNGGIAISFFCLATAGHAQTLPGQDAIVLDQVVIQGGDDSGKSGVRAKTATIGPLGRREIKDTPYSVSVIDKTLIENQQATTLPDLLKYMPSTQMEARGGGDVGRPQSRGMQGTPVFNNRLDGMNIVATTAQPIEMYERVEPAVSASDPKCRSYSAYVLCVFFSSKTRLRARILNPSRSYGSVHA